jgi:tetratricopeptide (TPR) repeat protein
VFKPLPLIALLSVLLPAAAVAQPPAAAQAGGRSASELLAAGEASFNSGNWQAAADLFLDFQKNFGGLEGTAIALAKVKPLLAICYVRLGKFDDALPLLDDALKQPALDPKQRVDLVFFSGLANLRTGKPDIARKNLGEIFTDTKVERSRRMEALILGGMSYVMEKNWKECITFFQKYGEEISSYSPEAGARAKILLLHALMQEQRWDEAAKLALELHAHLDETRQVVTFSSLMIELGAHFFDEKDYYQAIGLLRQVPVKADIERLQNARLAEAETDLKLAVDAKNPVHAAQVQTSIDEMKRELAAFAKIPQFDSAARLRLAGAYFQLNRTREACLIIDQMVRQMEPDAIVESATASLIRGWMSLERFSRAARTADLYLERCANLPEAPNLPDVMFLKAQALEGQFLYQEAADGYVEVATKFADKPIAARANFMAAYNILQLENYQKSGEMLDHQLKDLKKDDEMWAHVLFWRAMAYYFDQKWEDCRKLFGDYLADVKDGKTDAEYVDDAQFRIAFTYFSEARYPEAIKLLKQFATDFPQSEWLAEGLLTLGDSLAAEGDLDEADAVYAKIAPEAPGFYDEGWMKRGNLFKVKKDLPGMKKLYTAFLEKRPDSPRIAEALQWLGWVAKQEGDVPGARKIYWTAIERFGNEPARPGLEEIFLGLQTFYSGPDRVELETKLNDALAKAKAEKKKRFATRLGWALAQLQLSKKGSEESADSRALKSRESLIALVPEIEPKDTAPRILADVGDALADNGDAPNATLIYDGLRKWWPRAPERDRAYAGLGFLAARAKDETAALGYFDQFEKTSVMPKSAPDENGVALVEGDLGGKVALSRADLLASRDPKQALDIDLAIQKSKAMPALTRAEAFLGAARLHVSRKEDREALPYFEQVYLLFNRFPNLVAEAYLERGQALEKLNMPDKAREVYSELVSREDLAALEPSRLARQRAEALGGVIAPKEPEGGLIPPTPTNN